MKIACVISVLTLLSMSLHAQDTTSRSKYERFLNRSGKMFRTDRGLIGSVGVFKFELARTIDLQTGDSSKAVAVGNLFLDLEEIAPVVKALEYYKREIEKGKPKYEPFYKFITDYDVVASCQYTERGLFKGWSIELYKVYSYSRAYKGSFGLYQGRELDDLIKILKDATEVHF